MGQLAAVVVTVGYALAVSFALLKFIELALGGLRVSVEAENQGLDVILHGEEGYIFH